jgi:hypothetical protein
MDTLQSTPPAHGLARIFLSMLVVIAGQIVSMHAGITLKFAAARGTWSEELRVRMRRRQKAGGVVMMAGLAAMFVFCYTYNFWPGFTSHHRRVHVAHRPPAHDQFRELAAHLAVIPAWLVVVSTGSVIALSGAATGYALRRFRTRLRPPAVRRSFRGAMKWAALMSLAFVPLMYMFVFGVMWLEASTGEDMLNDPPRWLIPGIVVYACVFGYACVFAGPPAMFNLQGSRCRRRAWLRRQ